MDSCISKKINNLEIIEYIYQLNVAKIIKDKKLERKQLIKKIEELIETKESVTNKISKKEG